MDAAAPTKSIRTEHTLFSVGYKSEHGLQLQHTPFDHYLSAISHPGNYHDSQRLGSAMRAAAVQGFEYPSARDPDHGTCVGLFTTAAFTHKKPKTTQQWLCELSAETIAFKAMAGKKIYRFAITDFYHNGQLPYPA